MSSSNARSLLSLHVGQAGIQIGHATWELLCLEHNIEQDGSAKRECREFGNLDTVFLTTPQGHYFPRSIFVDTDPFCVDEVRSGPYRGLFNSHQLLSDQVDSGTNYATGRYGYSNSLLPDTIERLRWMMEKTDITPTICLFHSACGGTGSGFSVACLHRAREELGLSGRQSTLDFCVVPGHMAAQNSCELLNTALYLEESQDLVRQTFCVSNSALFKVCSAQLQSNGRATYAHVNRILATAFSNLTATERLPGSNVSLYTILDNLMPFENLKYPVLACAPFLTIQSRRVDKPSAKSATTAVLEPGSQFLDVDPRKGRHVAGYLLYRGSASFGEVQKLAQQVIETRRAEFHDWAPAGFRTGLIAPPPVAAPLSGMDSPAVSVTMVSSHSGIAGMFGKFAEAARRLQETDLFVHSFEVAIVALLGHSNKTNLASGSNPEPDPNNVSHWMMSPPSSTLSSEKNSAVYEVRQLRRRQTRSSGEHLTGSGQRRTGAMSDVFGVRSRLSNAIDYLEQVTKIYAAEENELPPGMHSTDSEDLPEGAVRIDQDVRLSELVATRTTLGKEEAEREARISTPRPSMDPEMMNEFIVVPDVQKDVTEDHEGHLEKDRVVVELSSERDEEPPNQHNCSMTMSSPASLPSTVPSFESSSPEETTSRLSQLGETIRRAANQFVCLRSRTKKSSKSGTPSATGGVRTQRCVSHQLDPQATLVWPPDHPEPDRSNHAEGLSAIAEAQRVLMKYRL